MANNLPKDERSRRGRPKGARNKIAADIKSMIEGALSAKGGQAYLEQQADENPVAFIGLIGKCLPKDMNVAATVGITYTAIPVEQRQSDSLASAAGTAVSSNPT